MGRPKQYPIRLTENEYDRLTKLLKHGKQSAIARRRAAILLALDQNHGEILSVKEIAQRCEVAVPTIYQLSRKVAQEGITDQLFQRKKHDYPPFIVTGKVEAAVIAAACNEPPAGYDRWTVRLLANHIVLEDGSQLSKTVIHDILKKRH